MRANIPNFLSQLHFVKIVSQRKNMEKVFVDCIVAIKYLLSFPIDKLQEIKSPPIEQQSAKVIHQPSPAVKVPTLESNPSKENAASSPSSSTLKTQPLTKEILSGEYKPATVVEENFSPNPESPPQQIEEPAPEPKGSESELLP